MGEEKMKISDIKGVGPKLAERIQQTLDIESLEQMLELTEEELKEVKGIGSGKAEKIFNSLEELGEECDRCDQKFLDQDTCPKCTAELEEELEPIRKEVEYFKNDNFSGERWELEKNLEKIDSELSEGRFEEVEELMESVEQELAEAQDLSDKLSKIEKKLEDKKVINLSTYREELELARDYMRYRDYEEGHNRAEKILDYLGEEKRYQDLDTSELLEESVEEFGRHMMGVGTRAGEKIYGSGLRTLKDVYNAEQEELQKEAGIEESTAKIVIDALDSLFEDIEIEREVEEETLPESEDQKTVKEEKVFEDTKEEEEVLEAEEEYGEEEPEEEVPEEEVPEEEVPEEELEEEEFRPVEETEEKERKKPIKKTKKIKKKKVVKKKVPEEKEEEEEPLTMEDILSLEEEQEELGQKDEMELKYWIPAIIIPIILAIAAYVLFVM